MSGQHIFKSWDGKRKVDVSKAPRWWPSTAEEAEQVLRSLPGVKVFEIGRSAGGRPIIAGAWGKREDLPNRTCYSLGAAVYGGSASAFYGKGERTRQSLVFVGNCHGLEFEGTVAAINMLSVVTTGKDLRGREWPQLQRAGRKLRIVIIPHLNIDGRARFPEHRHCIGIETEEWRRFILGELRDGTELHWPQCQLLMPLPPEQAAVLGAYYNDNGVNLFFDTGLGVDPQPETKALQGFLHDERPDCVLLSHTDSGTLVLEPDAFLPDHYRQRQAQLAALVGARCKYEGMKKWRVADRPYGWAGQALKQPDVVYHTCGAFPLEIEFPCGWEDEPGTFGEILDIGMYALEEILRFGVAYRFRPPDPKP